MDLQTKQQVQELTETLGINEADLYKAVGINTNSSGKGDDVLACEKLSAVDEIFSKVEN